ncbi:class I SAM-dependent methyltransferase [Methanomassiliicoccus luminyensis]|uniref:class I SAM-dependent methyltransferase n=1 Tax=Methanomassiliicoccus luminyensis TaxID=1080712 RepID=UPI00036D1180|nr:methyltransferase domain-containing protein [Methanomassiliicoccus luminyensis]
MSERPSSNDAAWTAERDDDSAARERLVSSFFSGTGKSYDRVVNIFTLGLDRHWKTEIVKLVPGPGKILDLACGTGILTERLARRFPAAEIMGVDITPDYLAEYDKRIDRKPWIRARSALGNAETVALDGEFDAAISSYLAKYVDPDALLDNIGPRLRKGGMFIAHDFILPTKPVYLAGWNAYTRAMNRVGPALFIGFRTVFDDGLTSLIRRTDWFDAFAKALERHDYADIHARRLSFETAGIIWATKT